MGQLSQNSSQLSGSLSSRQVTMMTLGGMIGAGLFIGSAAAIHTAGPAILISYALTGLLVFLVMRMLGEMAVMQPDSGSFSTYAGKAIGPWAGFSIGWLYWWFWVLIIPVEAIAGAEILHTYIPIVPSWCFAILIMLVLTGANLLNVKSFGEFEFWFALIKIIAILAFIGIGLLAVIGFWPLAEISGVTRLYQQGGFAPNGYSAVLAGILVTIFSFFGAEIVSIAAAESENPQEKIRRATNLVIYRIALFYLLSIFFVVALVDWNAPGLQQMGTFQYVLHVLNVPGTKLIIDFVVFIAVCSCMNTGIYIASRMLFSLSSRNEAPQTFSKLSLKSVPVRAVIFSSLAGFAGCIANYAFPGQVFYFLLSTTGSIALLVYLVIAISQLCMRRKWAKQGIIPSYKMWLFPWLTWAVIAMISSVLIYMLFSDNYRYESYLSLAVTTIVICCSLINRKKKGENIIKDNVLLD